MKTAICYLSCHHGNTRKVVQAMAEAGGADLIDVRTRQMVRLEEYDRVGFASGIYGFEMHRALIAFARQYLPESLFNLLKYANYNDYEEIELVDTSVCNQLLVSAWLADGKSVYESEQGEPMEDGFSLDDALRFAVNRSRTAAVSPTSEGCFGS